MNSRPDVANLRRKLIKRPDKVRRPREVRRFHAQPHHYASTGVSFDRELGAKPSLRVVIELGLLIAPQHGAAFLFGERKRADQVQCDFNVEGLPAL